MAFFKTKPNLPDDEKARIEFHFQQVADCIGFDRFQLPVIGKESLVQLAKSSHSAEEIVAFTASHLGHNADGLRVDVELKSVEQSGGGG